MPLGWAWPIFFILNRGHFFFNCFEREKERNISVREKHELVASHTHPDSESTLSLGMCLYQESNLQSFIAWDDTTTNEVTPARASLFWQEKCIKHSLYQLWPLVIFLQFKELGWWQCRQTWLASLHNHIKITSKIENNHHSDHQKSNWMEVWQLQN